jgi:thymidine kinase
LGLQFPDVVEFCEAMANAGKIVVVAALDGTYQRSGKFLTIFWLLKNIMLLFSFRFWWFLEFGAVG